MIDRSHWTTLPLPDDEALSVEARVRRFAADKPDALAVITPTETLTWGQVDDNADRLVGAFNAMGLKPGDRVGWLGRNRAEFVLVLVATRRARLVLAGLNWRLSPRELTQIIEHADPALIVADNEFLDLIPANRRRLARLPTDGVDDLASLIAANAPAPTLAARPGDPCTLFYTSGTSGVPKGVIYPLASAEAGVFATHTLEFAPDSVLLIVAPMFHMAGWMWTQYGLAGGMTQVLLPAADPASMLDAVARWGVTHAQWVPTMLRAAVENQTAKPVDLSTLRMIAYGASPIAPSLLQSAEAAFGCAFSQVYGLTETIGPATHLPAAAHHGPWGEATGFANPGIELRIIDLDGNDLGPGDTGEILIRTPWPQAQYWRLPEGAQSSFDSDGWLHSGDAGFLDADGCLHVTDRMTDMIITGGENVYPAEVEGVLLGLPGVRDAAVFGAPDDHWGQAVWAAVIPSNAADFDADALIAACRGQLSHYKCPRRIVVVETLARNATGKLVRRDIRDACLAAAPKISASPNAA